MENDTLSNSVVNVPLVCQDARFRAGRKLMERGQVHLGAVKIFSLLLGRANEEFGVSSVESAAVGYEYGYALFLNISSEKFNDDDHSNTMKADVSNQAKYPINSNLDDNMANDEDMTIEIALEHMVIACEFLYKHINGVNNLSQTDAVAKRNQSYISWAKEQLPRVLIGIGYVLSYQGKYQDALHSFLNAIPYRTERLESMKKSEDLTIEHVIAHRLLVEVYVLIVEEILKCPAENDITISETNEVLVKKEERVKVAKDHYEKAREELQEVIVLMSKLEAVKNSDEKENVCHLATLVMEAGISLSIVAD